MRRNGITIMGKLIGLVKSLSHIMCLTISLGVLGYLVSIFITIFGALGISKVLGLEQGIFEIKFIFITVILFAIFRGVLRYTEQASGHYIAFKLLALLRDKIFKALRKLAPAKLEGRDKGNLISIITTDIELLEVFYAHTIAPIAIGVITSIIMVIFIGSYNIKLGAIAAIAYFTMGYILPMINSSFGKNKGMEYRNEFGEMSTYFLESLRGIKEIIQFGIGEERLDTINKKSSILDDKQKHLKNVEGFNRALNESCITLFTLIMLAFGIKFYNAGEIQFGDVFVTTIAMVSSFAPVLALSNLSNNLMQTLASGERVLNILEEKPIVEDIMDKNDIKFGDLDCNNVNFSYGKEKILNDINMTIKKGKITGIIGKSGSGKSTLLKLIMRFWNLEDGTIEINGYNINDINTSCLRKNISYVTQETFLFDDTIKNNLKIAKADATDEEIIEACKKASIHDFIMTLPNGYDTPTGELGESLSGGERQRLGIARAFLYDADIMLLDEPTSNLDALNEGIILKSLKEHSFEKTIVLVSHRKSTMNIVDGVYYIESGRIS